DADIHLYGKPRGAEPRLQRYPLAAVRVLRPDRRNAHRVRKERGSVRLHLHVAHLSENRHKRLVRELAEPSRSASRVGRSVSPSQTRSSSAPFSTNRSAW